MRALVAGLVLLAGCAEISGLGSLDVCDGACVDATADVVAPQDSGAQDGAAPDSNTDDGPAPDETGADAPIITDGTIDAPPTGCTKPADCSKNDFCCATVTTQGNYPQCQITNVTTKCTSPCNTSIDFQQCKQDTVRMCSTNQDCTEAFYTHCCKFPYGDASVQVCSNPLVADSGGATCQ